MAKKRNLSDLIAEETQQTETPANKSETAEVSESATNKPSDSKTSKVTNLQTNKITESQTNILSDSKTNKVTELQAAKLTDSKTVELPNQQTDELSDSETDELPKYQTFTRKEARLREDQLDSLTSITRSLNRKRKGSGERITENTLIRIAVDLLMNQSDRLQGTTEEELSDSVGLD